MPGPDRVDQEPELAAGRRAERERPRQHAARRLEHEELPGRARVERAARDPHERVGADLLDADDRRAAHDAASQASGSASASWRSWSETASSARAFAIASTAARATASVVMHGTRAITAASRIA